MSGTKARGDVNLNYLLRFRCVGVGQMKYLLEVPEFRERIAKLTVTGKHVTEEMLLDVLRGLRDDVESGKIDFNGIPMPKIRNMIRRLEREIATKADS